MSKKPNPDKFKQIWGGTANKFPKIREDRDFLSVTKVSYVPKDVKEAAVRFDSIKMQDN
jgi:hypothetical protein